MKQCEVSIFGVAMMAMLLAVLGSACAEIPLRDEAPIRELVVQNPHLFPVELERVGGGSMDLGSDQTTRLKLHVDRYVLRARGVSYSVPLLSGSSKEAVVIEVAQRPDAPSGFVFVPGGPTLIGDRLGVGAVDERPLRIEYVAPLFVAEAEMTNANYVKFLNGMKKCDKNWIDLGGPKCRIRMVKAGSFETDAPELPVVTVSYPGATEYCKWKSRGSGQVYRLPTEIEWERFARGPRSSTYSYGDIYDPEAANQESGKLMPTRSFPATEWGIYDATGNAFEWTSSEFKPGLQVLKGGSYVLDGPYLRNAFRMWYRPLVLADDIGFRIVREIKP